MSGEPPRLTAQELARKRFIGLSLMAISALMFSVMSLCVHMLGDPKWGVLGPMQIGAFRFFLQAFFCTCIIVKSRVPWRPNSRKVAALLVIRGVFGTAGMLCFFYALTHMTISNATVLVFTNPIFTTVLGAVFLKEGFTLVDLVGTAVCFTGVVFVAQPAVLFGKSTADEKHSTNAVSVAVSLAGALLSSCGYIFVRMLGGQGANANMVVLWFGVVGTIIGVCMTAILREPLVWPWTGAQAGLVLTCGLFAYTAQFTMSKGLSMEKAGPAVMMRYLDIVFSFIWQLTVLSESVNAWSGLGAALVTSCAFVNPVKQWWMSRKRDPEETKPLLLDTELPKVKTVDTGRSIASTPLHESKSGDENLDRFYQGASEDEGGQAEVDDAPLVSPDVNLTK